MPPVNNAPVPKARWQITPGAPGPGAEQDPVNHRCGDRSSGVPAAVARAPAAPAAPIPFLIGQTMTIQQVIHPERSIPSQAQDLCALAHSLRMGGSLEGAAFHLLRSGFVSIIPFPVRWTPPLAPDASAKESAARVEGQPRGWGIDGEITDLLCDHAVRQTRNA